MAIPHIPPWYDQVIELFHGTTDNCAQDVPGRVDERRGSLMKDFGRGFYTTTSQTQAISWARTKCIREGGVELRL